MTLTTTLHRQLAIAIAAAGLVVLTMASASAQRADRELINRPTESAPHACWLDEGYGRVSNCHQGG